MQRGIQGAFFHAQHIVGGLVNPFGDGVAVFLPAHEGLQDEHVKRALQEISRIVLFGLQVLPPLTHKTIMGRICFCQNEKNSDSLRAPDESCLPKCFPLNNLWERLATSLLPSKKIGASEERHTGCPFDIGDTPRRFSGRVSVSSQSLC